MLLKLFLILVFLMFLLSDILTTLPPPLQIQQLVVLDLSHNRIYQIDERAFSSSPSLLELSLAHNPIKVTRI